MFRSCLFVQQVDGIEKQIIVKVLVNAQYKEKEKIFLVLDSHCYNY
jgi:hypothetical protein